MEITVFKGKGYTKFLFSGLGLPEGQEFSVFLADQEGGESLPHDHSVAEITAVIRGGITEIREVNGEAVTNHYGEGMQLDVPAGTRHRVIFEAADPPTVTVNWCEGPLSMNILKDFLKEVKIA